MRTTAIEMNRIRRRSENLMREIRLKLSAEQAINASKWDKESTWAKILRQVK